MSSTAYPAAPDVFLEPIDEYDRPRASWWNRLFSAVQAIEVELATDPSDIGTGYTANASIAELLGRRLAIEVGDFEVEYPNDDPVQIDFVNPGRFATAANLVVFVAKINDSKGRRVGGDFKLSTVVRTSGGSPIGFDFYRRNMTTRDQAAERFRYFAWEDAL